jgi:hypothetical protein
MATRSHRRLTCSETRSVGTSEASNEHGRPPFFERTATNPFGCGKKEGSERYGNDETQSGVTGRVSSHRPAFPRPAARRRITAPRSWVARPSRPAHAGPRIPSADEHLPQHHPAWTPRVDAELGAIPHRLQVRCKQASPRPTAYSQTGSRHRRKALSSLRLELAGSTGLEPAASGVTGASPECRSFGVSRFSSGVRPIAHHAPPRADTERHGSALETGTPTGTALG